MVSMHQTRVIGFADVEASVSPDKRIHVRLMLDWISDAYERIGHSHVIAGG